MEPTRGRHGGDDAGFETRPVRPYAVPGGRVRAAGADLPHQADIFIRGGAGFRDQTQFSKLGIPTITAAFGANTAG
ncbi:MAG TPA: hypothetical protein PKB06_04785, partial [Actinotalea sp.]|nr:hypothetical protein [Actinotalea sp.]